MPLFREKKEPKEGLAGGPTFLEKTKKTIRHEQNSFSKIWNHKSFRSARKQMNSEMKKSMKDSGIGMMEIGILAFFLIAGLILMIVK